MTEKIENQPKSVTKSEGDLPFELNLDSVSAWLQELPINSNGAHTQVFSTIRSLNKTRCDARLRLNILEKLRPVIFFMTGKSITAPSEKALPTYKKQRKAAKLLVKFHSELAIGYRLVTKSGKFDVDFSEPEQSLVIHRAMRSLSLTLAVSYQMYEPYSSRVWRDLNWLYQKAETNGLTSGVISDSHHPFGTKTTINSLYKCITIFAYINPYRFRQSEILEIYKLLERIADDAYLSPDLHKQGLVASLCVNLERGQPPVSNSHSVQFSTSRYFFTQKFAGTLTRLYEEALEGSDAKDYLGRLVQYFEHTAKLDKSGERKHSFLIQGFDEIVGLRTNSKRSLPSSQINRINDQSWLKTPTFELVPLEYGSNDQRNKQGSNTPSKSFPKFHQSEGNPGNDHNNENHSNNIHCYIAPSTIRGFSIVETDATLILGSIVAFWSDEEMLQVGVIRWKKGSDHTQRFQYGLELIGSDAYPATVSFKSNSLIQILLLKTTRNRDRHDSILLPTVKWKCGSRISINKGRRTFDYKIDKLLEINNQLFRYSLIEVDR